MFDLSRYRKLTAGLAILMAIIVMSCGGDGPNDPPEDPFLAMSGATVHFSQSESFQTMTITNSGGGKLDWTIDVISDSPWLDVFPESGSTTTETDTVQLTINRSTLDVGTSTDSLIITSNGGDRTIEVAMEVVPVVLSLPDLTTDACALVEIPLTIEDMGIASGIELSIAYDPERMTYDSLSTDLVGPFVNEAGGTIQFSWANVVSTEFADGDTLLTLMFSDLSGMSALTFEGYIEVVNERGDPYSVNVTNGSVECGSK